MTEASEAPKPTFRNVELGQVDQLADLKPVAKAYITEVGRWPHEWPAQPATYEQFKREEQILDQSYKLGRDLWEANGKDSVLLDDKLKPLAGIYLALLGKAQELSPEEAKRVTNAWMLETREGEEFMNIAVRYDTLVDRAKSAGCLGRLTGRKSVTQEAVSEMEEKIWEAFRKEETSLQTPTPSSTT